MPRKLDALAFEAAALASRQRQRHHRAGWFGGSSALVIACCYNKKHSAWLCPYYLGCFFGTRTSAEEVHVAQPKHMQSTWQMETDIVGTLLAGSLVAQVGEDKAGGLQTL